MSVKIVKSVATLLAAVLMLWLAASLSLGTSYALQTSQPVPRPEPSGAQQPAEGAAPNSGAGEDRPSGTEIRADNGSEPSRDHPTVLVTLGVILSGMDRNGDGVIDAGEAASPALVEARVRAGWYLGLQMLGVDAGLAEADERRALQELFARTDLNGDGVIGFWEAASVNTVFFARGLPRVLWR